MAAAAAFNRCQITVRTPQPCLSGSARLIIALVWAAEELGGHDDMVDGCRWAGLPEP